MVLLMKTSMLRFFCLPVLGSLLLTHMQGQTPAKTFRKVVSQYEIGAGDDFLRRIEEVNRDIAACGVVLYEPDGRKLLTGYAYHEMYDWDLYFENLYMSYLFYQSEKLFEPAVRQRLHIPYADRETGKAAFQAFSGPNRRAGLPADGRLCLAGGARRPGPDADRSGVQIGLVLRTIDAEHRLLDAISTATGCPSGTVPTTAGWTTRSAGPAGWTNSDTKGSIWPAIFTGSSGRWS